MEDNWIPGFPPGTFNSILPIPAETSVQFLMAESLVSWDEDLVRSFFADPIAEQILQVPISRFGGDDFLSWPHDKLGIYSVKSGYNLTRSENFFSSTSGKGKGLASNIQVQEKEWKALWSVNCPNKMKIVLWRFVHDCLPTGFQLVRRQIPADDGCFFCNRTERVEHLFLLCPFARSVWKGVKEEFSVRLCKKDMVNGRQWMFDFLAHASKLQATVLAITLWHIWEARNEVRNNGTEVHPARTASKVRAYVRMVLQHCSKPKPDPRRESSSSTVIWTPPPAGVVAVNVDAALFPSIRRMGMGFVARNHLGECMFAGSEQLQGFSEPELAEALAIRRALEVCRSEGCSSIVLASDCLSMVNKIKSTAQDRSRVGAVVSDIKSLASGFTQCSFLHVRRGMNVAAHKLARSCEHSVNLFYLGVVPDCIRDELCCDVQ